MISYNHPVILIEGLDGVGKSTLVRSLAAHIGATVIASPPNLPDPGDPSRDLRLRMDTAEKGARREYYRASNFHASLLIEEARLDQPVILDRYWPSTASFAVLDDDIPDWEPLGAWPLGLVEPDVMVVLTVSEAKRRERMEDRGLQVTEEEEMLAEGTAERAKVSDALLHFEPIEIDTSNLTPHEVLDEVVYWLTQCEIIERDNVVIETAQAPIWPGNDSAKREQA